MRSLVAATVVVGLVSFGFGCDGSLHFSDSNRDSLGLDASPPPPDAAAEDSAVASCTGDQTCKSPTPRCDVDSGVCVACESTSDCASGQTCVPMSHTCEHSCAEGPTEHDCPASAPTCNEKALYCVSCTSDTQCAAITDDGNHCDLQTGKCVDCLDSSQCDDGRTCDLDSNRCQ